MSSRFRVDLLHPGQEVQQRGWAGQTSGQWFIGPDGPRRLALYALGSAAVLVVAFVALVLPPYWRLSSDLNALPGLRRDLAARETDLSLLRSNLGALAEEARRQVRWGDLLETLSQQIPATLRLQVVDAGRVALPGAPGSKADASAPTENTIRIDSVTPLRPGSPPLLEVAQFMGGIMRDPMVNKRFQLKSWEIKPDSATAASADGPLLTVSIVLAERPQ